MNNFEIVISDTPFKMLVRSNTSTLIDSVIFIRTDQGTFPDKNWTDYSLSLLCMWCEDILRMSTRENETCILYFMDGPYWIEAQKKGEIFEFEARWDKKDYQGDFQGVFTFQCSLEDFLEEILRAFRKMLKILYQMKAEESVQNTVKESYQHYKKLIEKHTKSQTCAQEKNG